jgi:hypothetical protein
VAGVADEDGICFRCGSSEQARLGAREPERPRRSSRPVLVALLPDRLVLLDDFDSGPPESRDHLRVARIAALVGSEVKDTHPELVRDRLACLCLEHLLDMEVVRTTGALFVVARDQLAEEPE